MSGKDRERLKVLHEVRKRHITQQQAGKELGISPRWVRALLNRVKREGDRSGVPQDCRVRFSRRPPGFGRAFPDESPLAAKTWSIEPEILDDEFVWFVYKLGCRLSSAELSEEIAKQLARYHIEYETAYGRAS